ncbi:MAG: HXXEE domain-containing protein [Bacteroidales bacterium]
MKFPKIIHDRLSISWLFLVLCLLLHVIDEALNNFLDLYNPIVLKIKQSIPFLPLPTFTFRIWIAGLSFVIIILLFLTPLVYNRNKLVIALIQIFSILMIFNGLGHIFGSIYYSKIIAGMVSSPFLIIASICVIYFCRLKQKTYQNINS